MKYFKSIAIHALSISCVCYGKYSPDELVLNAIIFLAWLITIVAFVMSFLLHLGLENTYLVTDREMKFRSIMIAIMSTCFAGLGFFWLAACYLVGVIAFLIVQQGTYKKVVT